MVVQLEKQDQKIYFATELLAWFARNKRDLPWRRNKNPYFIWISEIMLQQTRVDTVIPYFERFIAAFPTLDALADAPEDEVLKLWEGLGYYSRARNLHTAVKDVQVRYGSTVPNTPEEIASLKGVGPYTAGAILSIAYDKPEPAVDGNVMRVLSRFFLLEDDIAKPKTRQGLEKLLRTVIPVDAAGDFNQALMELGALICTPKSPHCLICPVMQLCEGRLAGREEELPIKTKAKPPRPVQRLAALIEGTGEFAGKVLVRRRPDDGLLAKMWEIPHYEIYAATATDQYLGSEQRDVDFLQGHLSELAIQSQFEDRLMDTEHIFTHLRWQVRVYRFRLKPEAAVHLPETYRWIELQEMEKLVFPNLFIRILDHYAAHTAVAERS